MDFNNNLFEAILKNVTDGIVACDENGILVFFNRGLEVMHKLPLSPLGPDDWAKHYGLYSPDGSRLLEKEEIPLYRALKGEKFEDVELLTISPDGEKKHIYANGAQVKDEEGNVIGAVANMHDITEISKTAKKLAETRHLTEKVSNLTPGLITVFNVNSGIYKYVNNAVESMSGYNAQDFLTGGLEFASSLIHPDDAAGLARKVRKAIRVANDRPAQYTDNDAVQFEYRMRHKSGDYLWMHSYGVVFSRDANNRVEEVLNITLDITERKNAELKAEQSKLSEDYFRDLADQSPFMIWKVNEKGLCTYVNKPWCDFTGLSFEDSLNLGWGRAFHPEDAGPQYAKFMNCFKTLKPYHSKFRLKTRNGEYRWVLAQSNPLQQAVKGYIGSLTDITEQEYAEQATRQLMQKKDEFMSIASHELKTPVTSMKAALQIIERLSGKNKENTLLHSFVEKANNQVNKLSSLIDDLLDVTKIQAGKMELKRSTFSVRELISEYVDQFAFSSNNHKIILENIPAISIYADKERIGQVLTNFLSNSIKYSPGADKIIVEAKVVGDCLKVSVTDFGIGIHEDNQKHIFGRFFRVEGSAHQFSGLGLGLFISAQIIEKHEGKIGFISTEKLGSTFWFTVPVKKHVA